MLYIILIINDVYISIGVAKVRSKIIKKKEYFYKELCI